MIQQFPSEPFSNGIEYEFFLESFCYRCLNYKENDEGIPARTSMGEGGCAILDAMENYRFTEEDFPSDDVVELHDDGDGKREPVKRWHVCRHFVCDDKRLMKAYRKLFGWEDKDETDRR